MNGQGRCLYTRHDISKSALELFRDSDMDISQKGNMSFIKTLARRVIGPKLLGMTDYYRFPERRKNCEGAFNSQKLRKQIFSDLLKAIDIEVIIETGTFKGATTEYLYHKTDVPIFTVEKDERLYGFSKVRFLFFREVNIENDDSRSFLKKVLEKNMFYNKIIFFYLDAHWDEDLPLFEEIEIIFDRCKRAIVMIDDFRVLGDDLYGYDNYGEGKEISTEYIAPLIERFRLSQFFPAFNAQKETGMRRGCVILLNDDDLLKRVRTIFSLCEWSPLDS